MQILTNVLRLHAKTEQRVWILWEVIAVIVNLGILEKNVQQVNVN